MSDNDLKLAEKRSFAQAARCQQLDPMAVTTSDASVELSGHGRMNEEQVWIMMNVPKSYILTMLSAMNAAMAVTTGPGKREFDRQFRNSEPWSVGFELNGTPQRD